MKLVWGDGVVHEVLAETQTKVFNCEDYVCANSCESGMNMNDI